MGERGWHPPSTVLTRGLPRGGIDVIQAGSAWNGGPLGRAQCPEALGKHPALEDGRGPPMSSPSDALMNLGNHLCSSFLAG